MQLTVSQRLIAGFSLVGILIVVISISSLVNMRNIQQATSKVHEQTLPVLSLSKDLQAQFLLMSKYMLQGYVEQNSNQIMNNKSKFTERKEHFNRIFAQLEKLTQPDRDLRNMLGSIGVAYAQYQAHTDTMFAEHIKQVLLQQQPVQLGASLGGVIDSAVVPNTERLQVASANDALRKSKTQIALDSSEEKMALAIQEIDRLIAAMNTHVNVAKEYVEQTESTATWQILLIAITAIVMALIIGISTIRAISRPLGKTNDMLRIIASGDLSQQLDDSSHNEFGQLAKNVNTLVSSLKVVILGIGERAERLAAAAEQTSTVTTKTTLSIDEQKSQIAIVSEATNRMQARASNVKANAEATLAQIKHADTEAAKIKHISLENKRTIETLATDVDAAAQVIHKLHQDSASISGILDVIRGVADQTNLLALNAAIEAARAGEQGRGFAVVADEVRTLASRTQESTQEINSMIEMLQEGAERAVTVMNQGKAQTEICVEQTMRATDAIDSITHAVHEAHDVSSQIEESARTNSEVSRDISNKLESIVGISHETSVGALQTSESSKAVSKLAEELQQSIQHFKV